MYPLIIAFQLRTPAAPARMRVMSRQRSSQFLPDPVTDAFYQEKVKGLMFFCTGVLVFVSFSLLSSTRSSVTIRVLITPIPLPIVLVNRLLVLPPRACPANPAELPSTYGTQWRGTSHMSIYHKPLSTTSVGVLWRRQSVATTTGSVCDPAPTTPARVSTATNLALTSGTPQKRHQLPAHITLPAPPSPTVSRHSAHPQQTRIMPFVEQVEHIAKVVQPALPPTIATDDVTRAVAARDRLSAATPGLRVALAHLLCGSRARRWCRWRTWGAMTRPAGVGRSGECAAHVYVPLCDDRRDPGQCRRCSP